MVTSFNRCQEWEREEAQISREKCNEIIRKAGKRERKSNIKGE
jgi:predicted nucleic acid-binding Zn ribbon protein